MENHFSYSYVEENLGNTGILSEVRLTHISLKEFDSTKLELTTVIKLGNV
jgi:hypothetical protein